MIKKEMRTKTVEYPVWIASDGVAFEDKAKCDEHEDNLLDPIFADANKIPHIIWPYQNIETIADEYDCILAIYPRSREEIDALDRLASATGGYVPWNNPGEQYSYVKKILLFACREEHYYGENHIRNIYTDWITYIGTPTDMKDAYISAIDTMTEHLFEAVTDCYDNPE